jgi:peptidoglycan/LPS O-acetylase OafA/YrhL
MSHNDRIEQIDVWRFLAIALVVFSHIVKYSHSWYKDFVPGLVWRAQPLGLLGVQLFFCISGFVICRGMLKESARDGSVNLRAFYIRRAFRILPPLLLYIAVLMLLSLGGVAKVTMNQVLPALGFSCNLNVIDCGWLLGHTWSLAFEEQFYLVFPLLFLAAALATQRNRLFTIAFAMLITSAIAGLTGHDAVGHYVSTFSYMVWGCVFALYWDKLQPLLANLPFSVWLLTALALPGVHLVAMPAVFQTIYPAIAPLAICVVIFGTPAQHVIARPMFANTWFAYLGRISYSIYLWQQLATGNLGLSSPLYAVLFIPCVLCVAHLSFRYVEMPMIALGAGLAARSRKPASIPFDDPLAPRNDTYWRS